MNTNCCENNTSESRHPFATDRPITRREEDLLGVAPFADAIANAISKWKQKDSLVVALNGAWGSGKTSVKNIVIETLRTDSKDCPTVIEFNPWQWSGEDRIVTAFFTEIGKVLFDTNIPEKRDIATKLLIYARYLRFTEHVTEGIRNLVTHLISLTGGATVITSLTALSGSKLAGGLTAFLVLILMALEGLLKWGGGLMERIADILNARSLENQAPLEKRKAELVEMFSQLNCPVVVIIDDIDRLTSEEIRLLFRLLKANADFPNLVYFVLFQRDIVEHALSEESDGKGRDYLGKIVQVGFDLPAIQRASLEKILFEGLDDIFGKLLRQEDFDQQRWGNIYVPGLREFFQTLRDVRRFLSMFSFHANLFCGSHAFEVNPVDLVSLEVLRVYEPDVYKGICQAKSVLTGRPAQEIFSNEKLQNAVKEDVKSIIALALVQNRKHVEEIIKRLFPAVEWIFGGSQYSSDFDEIWLRELRVCHQKIFDRYFHFMIPEGDISKSDIQLILNLANNREKLVAYLKELEKRGILPAMLDRLEAYKERIDISHAESFVTAIMDIGDDLPDDRAMFNIMTSSRHASRIIIWYLLQEPNADERWNILRKAMTGTKGLHLVVDIAAHELDEEGRKKTPKASLVSDDRREEIKALALEKIRVAASDGRLINNQRIEFILWRWREWAPESESKKWIVEAIKSDSGFLAILNTFTHKILSQGMGSYVAQETWT